MAVYIHSFYFITFGIVIAGKIRLCLLGYIYYIISFSVQMCRSKIV